MNFVMQLLLCLLFTFQSNSVDSFIDLLPENIENWAREREIKIFLPENLFDYINGDADRFLPYNFEKLVVVFYKKKVLEQESTVEIQVYQMGSILDAFGIYSVHRDRSKEIFPYGSDGFIGDTQAMFYQDRFFVKINVTQSDDNKRVLNLFGKYLSTLLPSNLLISKELDCLGVKEKILRTEKYLVKDVMSQSFLPKGMLASFRTEKGEATGFIVMFISDKEASEGLRKYIEYLESIGAEFRRNGEELQVMSPDSEVAILAIRGDRMVGVWEPGGNLNELKKLHSNIFTCLGDKSKQMSDVKREVMKKVK